MKITAIATYKELAEVFKEVFEKHNLYEQKLNTGNDHFELEIVIAANAEEAQNKLKGDTDVIIARGATALNLREMNYDVPVVELPIPGYDLTNALYQLKKQYNCKKVGAIGSINMIMGISSLAQVMGMEIKSYYMYKNEDIKSLVDQAVSEGMEAIVGGVNTCIYAEKLGLKTVFIRTGEEAVWYAISEAKRVAYLSRKEQEKALRFKAILDYAYEGVIALDNRNYITVFNSAAGKMLGIDATKTIGQNLDDVLPSSEFTDLIHGEKECKDEIVQHQNEQLTVNKVPIILKGEKVGKVITFQDVPGIQEMEGKIRKKIYTRGHIARYTFKDILGKSKNIREAIEIAKEFSQVNSNILIVGESGTGKELFAQSIHNQSPRRKGPFVAVNCAALPEELLESELFGYVEGAFTGAVKGGKTGLFEMAHGGTIFLDEISEVSPKLQSRLLRVIQEKEIMRLGDDRVTPVDIRVISATNRDLYNMAQQREFRLDLYYRLDILKINLPPLRERKEDIPIIATEFIKGYCRQLKKSELVITHKAMEVLKNYDWPGNIRELRNICERLVVLNRNGSITEKEVYWVLQDKYDTKDFFNESMFDDFTKESYNLSGELKRFESERIIAVLKSVGYNNLKAAKILGMSRTTLWRRLKELGISKDNRN